MQFSIRLQNTGFPWPRLVVALATDLGDGAASAASGSDVDIDGAVVGAQDAGLPITVTAVMSGMVLSANSGCPQSSNVIDCQYVFYGSPTDTEATLQVAVGNGAAVTKVIPLQPFNYCGIDVAYVRFSLTDTSPQVVIGDPQYVSPCKAM
jgi:hypothetical protein